MKMNPELENPTPNQPEIPQQSPVVQQPESKSKKKRILIAIVVFLLVALAVTALLLTRNNTDPNQASQPGTTNQSIAHDRLLACSIMSGDKLYNPETKNFAKTNQCLDTDHQILGAYSHNDKLVLYTEYLKSKPDQTTLYLATASDPTNKQKVISVVREKNTILEIVWYKDDSGFMYTVRDDDDPRTKELGDPYAMNYFAVSIKDGKALEPKKIHSSDGTEGANDNILGYDQKRHLLIMDRTGSSRCSEILVKNLKESTIKEIKNDSCYITIDYDKNLLYKVDGVATGKLIAQDYLTGKETVLATADTGFFKSGVAADDLKYIYMVNDVSGSKPGENTKVKEENNAIVRYSLTDNKLETIRKSIKASSLELNLLSNDGSYLVFNGQHFNEQNWPIYYSVINTQTKEENEISKGEPSGSTYFVWLTN